MNRPGESVKDEEECNVEKVEDTRIEEVGDDYDEKTVFNVEGEAEQERDSALASSGSGNTVHPGPPGARDGGDRRLVEPARSVWRDSAERPGRQPRAHRRAAGGEPAVGME